MDSECEQLAARGVEVRQGPVAAWSAGGARQASGRLVALDALVVAPVFTARAAVLASLGVAAEPVGCGEGADAVWLARPGWQVTAVDLSAVALERASGHAASRGPTPWT